MVPMRSKWSLPPPGGGGAGGTGWSAARHHPSSAGQNGLPSTTPTLSGRDNGPPPSPWGRAVVVRPGIRGAPSAGFEPAHTAPEAVALSPELRGQREPAILPPGSSGRPEKRPCTIWAWPRPLCSWSTTTLSSSSCSRSTSRWRGSRSSGPADGAEGLERAREVLPDIVILDVMMPRMTGYEVAKALREDDAHRPHPDHLRDRPGPEQRRRAGHGARRRRLRHQAVRPARSHRPGQHRCWPAARATSSPADTSRPDRARPTKRLTSAPPSRGRMRIPPPLERPDRPASPAGHGGRLPRRAAGHRRLRPRRAGRTVRHAAVRLRRGPPPGPLPGVRRRLRARRRRLRRQGLPVPGHGPAGGRGGPPPRRRHRRRAARGPLGRLPGRNGSSSTATTSPTTSWPPPSPPASGGSWPTPSPSSTGSRRWSKGGRRPSQGHAPGDPGRRGPHPRVHRDRHRGLEVRLPRPPRRRPARPPGGWRPAPTSTWPGSTATSARQIHVLAVLRRRGGHRRRPGRRRWRRPPARAGQGAQPGRRPRHRLPRRRRAADGRRVRRRPAPVASTRPWPESGLVQRAGAAGRAGPVDRRHRRRHPLPGRHHQGDRRRPHLRGGGRGHERQRPSRHLRRPLRGVPARAGRRPSGRWWPPWPASTASRATSSSATPPCPPTWPSATFSAPRRPGRTVTPWPATTTRFPARRSCSWADGDARLVVRRETLDDLLRLEEM